MTNIYIILRFDRPYHGHSDGGLYCHKAYSSFEAAVSGLFEKYAEEAKECEIDLGPPFTSAKELKEALLENTGLLTRWREWWVDESDMVWFVIAELELVDA